MTVNWAWSGGITHNAGTVVAQTTATSARLAVSLSQALTSPTFFGPVTPSATDVARFTMSGLVANKRYWYAVEEDGVINTAMVGTFQTDPVPAGGICDYTFAVSSCAGVNGTSPGTIGLAPDRVSNHVVFDRIRQFHPDILFFAHIGDFSYYDFGSGVHVPDTSLSTYRDQYNAVLQGCPRQGNLYRNCPIVYQYDDHDFGINNSDGTNPGKGNCVTVFREVVPYETLAESNAVYRSFQKGRVLFIVSDTRYYRDPDTNPDGPTHTMLGSAQKTWLDNVLADTTAEAVVWLNPTPWMGIATDTWNGFNTERDEVAGIFDNHNFLHRMVCINGDNHQLALDDGGGNTHGGFPVWTAGSLDCDPGPDSVSLQYNMGPSLPGASQWVKYQVRDYGNEIVLTGKGVVGGLNWWRQLQTRIKTSTALSTTFPRTEAPWKVEIAPGGEPNDATTWEWVDVTNKVRFSDGITITNGRADEWGETAPSSCQLTFDNRTGDFSPRNPLGTYYGQLRRNTPIRVRWITDENPISQSLPTNNTAGWVAARCTIANNNGSIRATLTDVSIQSALAQRINTPTSLAAQLPAVAGRTYTLTGQGRSNTPSCTMGMRIEFKDGASVPNLILGVSGSAVAVNSSTFTDLPPITVTAPAGTVGVVVWYGQVGGTRSLGETFDIRNGVLDDGVTSMPIGPVRFQGFVSEWPPRWDKSGANAYAPIQADGLMRRLQQGEKPLRSVLYRILSTVGIGVWTGIYDPPAAYWPLEDNVATRYSGSPIEGVQPMRTDNFTFEAASDLPASGPLPTMGVGSSYFAPVPQWANPTAWHVEFIYKFDSAPTGTNNIMVIKTDANTRWNLAFTPTTIVLTVYDNTGAVLHTNNALATNAYGDWSRLSLDATANGANVDYKIVWFPIGQDGFSFSGTVTGQDVGSVSSLSLGARGSGASDVAIGHISVFKTNDVPWYVSTDTGFDGDKSVRRVSDICIYENVPFQYVGTFNQDASYQMGPYPIDTFMNICRECEATDGGILHELEGTLAYTPQAVLLNQDVSLALDQAQGHISDAFEPTDDDQQLRNDVTVSRKNGSEFRYVAQPSFDDEGKYDESVSLSLTSDLDAPNIAAWLAHLGTVDQMRFPSVTIDLARNPDLIEPWMLTRLGARATINHAVGQIAGVDIDVLIDGWTETFDTLSWKVTLNTSPAQGWNVGILDDAEFGRIDTDGSNLTAALAAPSAALNTNTGFETNTTDWVGNQASIARSTAQAHSGVASCLVTPNGSLITCSLDRTAAGSPPVTLGTRYTFRAWVYSTTGWPTMSLALNWRDATPSTILSQIGPTVNVPAGVWTLMSMSGTAPTNATAVLMRVRETGTPNASNTFYVDDAELLLDSALQVSTVAGGPQWTQDPAEFPFDIVAGGERMTVLDVDGGGLPTFVAAGTAATGNNSSVTPGLPAGTTVGDLVLIAASIRTTSGTVTTPSGWTSLLGSSNFKVMGRIYDGVWTMPTVSFTGGAAGDDTIGQSCAFRGVQMGGITTGGLGNASAQNIAFPARAPRLDQPLVLYAAWKQDDFTSTAVPAIGFTEIQETVSTAGNDAGQVWGYRIGDPCPMLPAGSLVVTGGAAAVSKGFTFAFQRSDQVMIVNRSVNGIAKAHVVGEDVRLYKPMYLAPGPLYVAQ